MLVRAKINKMFQSDGVNKNYLFQGNVLNRYVLF